MTEENASLFNDEDIVEEPKKQFMTFHSCDEVYGISLENVNEIIGLQQYTAVPDTEEYIKGLINLRGKIIPVIDVRVRFGKESLEYNERTSVIVINVKETTVGLIVDSIEGVADVLEKDVIPPPSVSSLEAQAQKYVYGIAKTETGVKLLLDPDKLINERELIEEEQND